MPASGLKEYSFSNVAYPVYGPVHYVHYNGMQFYLGQSLTEAAPHPMSIHYLIPPNLLLISEFTLL